MSYCSSTSPRRDLKLFFLPYSLEEAQDRSMSIPSSLLPNCVTANNISDYPDRHSLIELPHPFISPGEVKGRFREQHYWDSYWVIHGLLISNMTQTARGMILNFASLVDRIGYVPIGNRVYYQNRPQMPMLAAMVKLYWLHTAPGSDALIQQVLPAIEKEYYFWSTSRSVDVAVNGKIFKMARYKSSTSKQRPESYREDHETARSLRNRSTLGVEGKFYANVAAASESGWEFSTRWLDQPHKSMTEIRTEDIIPVDLNAAMCLTEHHLATFYKILGDERKFSEFTTKAIQRGDAIQAVFWNEGLNMWRDFDLKYHKPRKEFYMSNIAPLFAACSSSTVNLMETNFLQRIVASNDIKRSTSFPGGVPVSFVRAEESCHSCQWDFPNMWPTMQLMLIESLARNSDLKPLASTWAQNMIGVIHGGYMQHGNMFEKYNVNKSGYYGVGGEYAVQNGYASTNGAVLRLLELFPTELSDNGNNEIFDREETVNGVHKEISKERDNLKDSDVFQFDAQLSSAMADTNKKSESASHKREEPSSATGINAEHSPQKLSRLNSGTKYCQSSVQLSVSILLILVINIHI